MTNLRTNEWKRINCKLQKTDLVINTEVGRRIVYYAPDADLCCIHHTPRRQRGCYAAGGWYEIDCDRSWTKTKETIHEIELVIKGNVEAQA